MSIELRSDFRDYYDFAFPSTAELTFDRLAGDRSMTKLDQFRLLSSLGLRVPFVALGRDMLSDTPLRSDDLVVAYTDDRAHCGEGKKLVQLRDLSLSDDALLCSQWINTSGLMGDSISYRLLQIGVRSWLLRYEGTGGWMSNHCDDTAIFIKGECLGFQRWANATIDALPLFAIDFVVPVHAPTPETIEDVIRDGYAIDFNSAPGMRWTGMNDLLSAIEVYSLVKDWILMEGQ